MKLILVCGPFGSGTTAVAGLLARLGAIGFGPYIKVDDERTGNTYELAAFREVLRTCVSEGTLAPIPGIDIKAELGKFRDRLLEGEFGACDKEAGVPIFLKHPLAALVIPQICQTFETRLVYAVRPLRDIEATRRRRKWLEQYGAKGAGIIYSQMFTALIEHTVPTVIVRYGQLIAAPHEHARLLADFAGLKRTPDEIGAAAAFIRGR